MFEHCHGPFTSLSRHILPLTVLVLCRECKLCPDMTEKKLTGILELDGTKSLEEALCLLYQSDISLVHSHKFPSLVLMEQ